MPHDPSHRASCAGWSVNHPSSPCAIASTDGLKVVQRVEQSRGASWAEHCDRSGSSCHAAASSSGFRAAAAAAAGLDAGSRPTAVVGAGEPAARQRRRAGRRWTRDFTCCSSFQRQFQRFRSAPRGANDASDGAWCWTWTWGVGSLDASSIWDGGSGHANATTASCRRATGPSRCATSGWR